MILASIAWFANIGCNVSTPESGPVPKLHFPTFILRLYSPYKKNCGTSLTFGEVLQKFGYKSSCVFLKGLLNLPDPGLVLGLESDVTDSFFFLIQLSFFSGCMFI